MSIARYIRLFIYLLLTSTFESPDNQNVTPRVIDIDVLYFVLNMLERLKQYQTSGIVLIIEKYV